jgi:hypothetical protein
MNSNAYMKTEPRGLADQATPAIAIGPDTCRGFE